MPKPLRSFSSRAAAAFALCAIFAIGSASQSRPLESVAYDTGWAHDENSGNGYAYFSAHTFVDCKDTRIGYRQSADILTGGYAHDAAGRERSYADMGLILENDTLKRGEIGTPNKVQLYGQASAHGGSTLLRFSNAGDASQRFFNVACDTPIALTFWVASASKVVVRYDGTFVSKFDGKRFTGSLTTAIAGFAPDDGWSVACAYCAVRRVDTLAVASDGPTRIGAYFGMRDVLGVREPAEYWTNAIEGGYVAGDAGAPTSYAIAPFFARSRDIVDAPANAQRVPEARPAFVVRHQGMADEELGLDQRAVTPPTP